MSFKSLLRAASALLVTLAAAQTSSAADVAWSVHLSSGGPRVGVVIAQPVYAPPPVVYYPAPVYYPPVVVQSAPQPVIYPSSYPSSYPQAYPVGYPTHAVWVPPGQRYKVKYKYKEKYKHGHGYGHGGFAQARYRD